MPELRNPYGYFIVLGVMFFLVVGMVIYFKKKKWF
jgi:magnesium transporter